MYEAYEPYVMYRLGIDVYSECRYLMAIDSKHQQQTVSSTTHTYSTYSNTIPYRCVTYITIPQIKIHCVDWFKRVT